ncbi:MAG: divergent PAP2 family protein, partial [Ruminococcus sp.]|nr:divergent PAP2 family protein [Ruminococcus sp.]
MKGCKKMNNPVLTSGILSWLAAQIIKTLLHAVKSDKLVLERFVGAGGMPSSHTAMVLGTLITTGRLEGTDSALFGVAFVFSAVVIYDAMNVRRAAGLHA